MLRVEKYKPGDVYKQAWRYKAPKNKDRYFQTSHSYSYWVDSQLVAITSFLPVKEKAIVTLLPVKDIRKYKISLVKHIKASLDAHIGFFGTQLLITQSPSDEDVYHRWLSYLGFTRITDSRKYVKHVGG